jgi:hypothetical protein
MVTDSSDDSHGLVRQLSDLYWDLLGEYRINRKASEAEDGKRTERPPLNKSALREALQEFKQLRQNKVWKAYPLDFFSQNVVYKGGSQTLERLLALDKRTLATFVEWNRVNLVIVEQNMFIRRVGTFLFALVPVVGLVVKDTHLIPTYMLEIFLGILGIWLKGLIPAIITWIVLELVIWRRRKLRLIEFGQMLSVAFAYVAGLPGAEEKEKDNKNSEMLRSEG